MRVDNERYPRQVGELVRDDPDAPLGHVVFLGVVTAAVLVFGGTMLVLAWLLVASSGGT